MANPADRYQRSVDEYRRKTGDGFYERMCDFHEKYHAKKVNSPIPKRVTAVGKKYLDSVAVTPIGVQEAMPPPPNVCQGAVPFGDLEGWQKEAVFRQLKAENSQCEIERSDFNVSDMAVDDLPITSIEYGLYDKHVTEVDMEYDLKTVKRVADSISRSGYDGKQPVVVWYYDKPVPSISLYGGHHRIQALRNLEESGGIPKGFRVPSVVVCPKRPKRSGRG